MNSFGWFSDLWMSLIDHEKTQAPHWFFQDEHPFFVHFCHGAFKLVWLWMQELHFLHPCGSICRLSIPYLLSVRWLACRSACLGRLSLSLAYFAFYAVMENGRRWHLLLSRCHQICFPLLHSEPWVSDLGNPTTFFLSFRCYVGTLEHSLHRLNRPTSSTSFCSAWSAVLRAKRLVCHSEQLLPDWWAISEAQSCLNPPPDVLWNLVHCRCDRRRCNWWSWNLVFTSSECKSLVARSAAVDSHLQVGPCKSPAL